VEPIPRYVWLDLGAGEKPRRVRAAHLELRENQAEGRGDV
jgi:hypothetical protein